MLASRARAAATVQPKTLKIRFEKVSDDSFGAVNAARKWLDGHGYRVGSMQRSNPIGVGRSTHVCEPIPKWSQLTDRLRAALDGEIRSVGDGYRDNACIVIFDDRANAPMDLQLPHGASVVP